MTGCEACSAALVVDTLAAIGRLAVLVSTGGFDSTTEELIRTLNQHLLYIAVPITLLVESILLYTVLRFRKSDEPQPTRENRRLEITWTVATALVLVFVGVASYQVLAHPAVNATPPETATDLPEDAVNVTITGQQFLWTFEYPDANVTSQGPLVLPTNRTIVLQITSQDVIHSVHIPGLGLKQDAIPGQFTYIETEITNEGTYRLYCAEYCGAAHSDMLAEVRVVSPAEYERWLENQ